MRTLYLLYLEDAYEINFTLQGVSSILRYRQAKDGRGEQVDYDHLPHGLQELIYKRLKKAIDDNSPESIP